jgi:type I restriction enzyme M protein
MTLRHVKDRLKKEQPNLSEVELNSQVKYYAEHKVFGTDINERMARVAKMNMIMHGDGHAGVFNTNGLLTDEALPQDILSNLTDSSFSIIFSNPPFAGREKDADILKQFDLGKNSNGMPSTVSKEVLFVEKIIRLLDIGGKAGLVLPAGCFNNSSMTKLRDHIKTHAKIIALIGLPHLSFQVSGANNEGHLLFIEKVERIPEDYPIFVDWANDVGIDVIGKKIEKNDLNTIIARFQSPPNENTIMFSQLEDRIDPWYYHPKYAKLKKILKKTKQPWLAIGEIFKQSEIFFDANAVKGKTVKYIEKGDVDVEAGIIRSVNEHTQESLPTWAKWILEEGDVLFPRAFDSMRGVAIVPKEFAGIVCTGGLIVVKHDPQKIRLPYAKYHFSQPEILALIKQCETGEINPKYTWAGLSAIEVPLPSLEEQDRILKNIEEIEKKRAVVRQTLAEIDLQIDAQVRRAVPKIIGNYEEIKIKRAEFIGEAKIEEPKV